MDKLLEVVLYFVFFKSVFIGSEFNFYRALKHGSKYTKWYFNRPTWKDFLENEKKDN